MRYCCFLILFLLALPTFAQTEEDFQTLEERGYGIYLPSGYDGSADLPLVLALHGFGDEWRNFSRAADKSDVPVNIIASSSLQKSKSTLAPTISFICAEQYLTILGSENVRATSILFFSAIRLVVLIASRPFGLATR